MNGIFETKRVRVSEVSEHYGATKIRSTSDAGEVIQKFLGSYFEETDREEFHVLTLDTKNKITGIFRISVGTLDASLVHPREVFKPAIMQSASSVILTHNHPSGDPTPSNPDYNVTERLCKAGELLGIDVLDHIVVGDTCVSIREENPSIFK